MEKQSLFRVGWLSSLRNRLARFMESKATKEEIKAMRETLDRVEAVLDPGSDDYSFLSSTLRIESGVDDRGRPKRKLTLDAYADHRIVLNPSELLEQQSHYLFTTRWRGPYGIEKTEKVTKEVFTNAELVRILIETFSVPAQGVLGVEGAQNYYDDLRAQGVS